MKKLGALVGWLSGAAAGLTALLYAMGFVATLAQLNVLGIEPDFASRDAFEYVGRGASAVWRGTLGAVVPGLVLVLIWELVGRLVAKGGPASPSLLGDAALVLAMMLVAGLGLGYFLFPALAATSLLFADDITLCKHVADAMTNAIVRGEHLALSARFLCVAVTTGIVASLAWLGARRMMRGGVNRILLALYAVTVVAMILVIPVAHGVFLGTTFPRVELTGDAVDRFRGSEPLLLLQHGDKGTLLWSRSTREVLWLRADSVPWLRVGVPTQLYPGIKDRCAKLGGGK